MPQPHVPGDNTIPHTPGAGSRSDLYRVVAARFLSRAGSEAAFFVGIWGKAAFQLHGSARGLALLMFGVATASILGSFVAGALVDRWGPRRVLALFEVLFVPTALAVALADSIPRLTAIVGVWAFVGAPVVTAGASFAPFLARKELPLDRINAWIEGAGSLSFAVGPAIGALLVRYANVNWVFVLDAATSLAAAVLVWKVALVRPGDTRAAESAAPGKQHLFSEFAEGLRTVYTHRPLRFYVVSGSLVWLAFGSFGALEPLFFRDVVGTTIEALGWINAVFGLGFMTGAALLPRVNRKMISARGLTLTVVGVGLGTVLYVGSPDLRVIAVGAFVWASVIGLMEPLLRTLIHRDSPREVVGRVVGTAEVHRRVGELLPLAVAPTLANAFGVQAVMIGGGVFATLVATAGLAEASRVDRLVGRTGVEAGELQGLHASDEPISPNP